MKLVCIRCPRGCNLNITKKSNGQIIVTGNSCPRGEEYGKQEITQPKRTITTIQKIDFGTVSLVTSKAIDKNLYFDVLKKIKNTKVKPNPQVGDVFIKNIFKTKVDIIISGIHMCE